MREEEGTAHSACTNGANKLPRCRTFPLGSSWVTLAETGCSYLQVHCCCSMGICTLHALCMLAANTALQPGCLIQNNPLLQFA
jgi:hypothetical protein